MPGADDVEKFLHDQKSFEDRRQALVEDLLRQKAAAMKEFDDKLAKLGYDGDGATKSRRSHHRKGGAKTKA
jgi:hypothetical protein